jgi:hypothetical protein
MKLHITPTSNLGDNTVNNQHKAREEDSLLSLHPDTIAKFRICPSLLNWGQLL